MNSSSLFNSIIQVSRWILVKRSQTCFANALLPHKIWEIDRMQRDIWIERNGRELKTSDRTYGEVRGKKKTHLKFTVTLALYLVSQELRGIIINQFHTGSRYHLLKVKTIQVSFFYITIRSLCICICIYILIIFSMYKMLSHIWFLF